MAGRKLTRVADFSYVVERASEFLHDVPAEAPDLEARLPVKEEAYAHERAIDSSVGSSKVS